MRTVRWQAQHVHVVLSGSIDEFVVRGVTRVAVENQQHWILSGWLCVVNEMLKPQIKAFSCHPAAGIPCEDCSGPSSFL